MWTARPIADAPQELAGVTSSIWQYEDVATVGVIRKQTMLMPPYLWAEIRYSNLRLLRKARGLMTDLQKILGYPVVFAEVGPGLPQNDDFLTFLGFEMIPSIGPHNLFKRSIL